MTDSRRPPGRGSAARHPVVAGYGGADSVGAVQLGEQLAVALGEPLVIASAYGYEPAALSARVGADSENELRMTAAAHRAERAHRLVHAPIDVSERVIPADGIADALVDLAREVDAAMIVLGRDLKGHVTRAVIQHSPCPVAVSPFTVAVNTEHEPTRIGVAYDGTTAARLALDVATRVAGGAGVERLCFERDAAERLVAASAKLDLLVCGSRGRGPTLAAVLGSVSAELIRSAHCPVIVVPPAS